VGSLESSILLTLDNYDEKGKCLETLEIGEWSSSMTLVDMRWEAGCGDRLKPRLAVHDCRCKLRTESRKKVESRGR
jgi:hypothetical protein